MVDEAGYLPADLSALPEKLGAPPELVERVLASLQTLDPPGVFARNLAECLALQLKEQNRYDPVIAAFLDNLHLLANHNLPALKRAVGVEMDELMEFVAEIKRLNPKPGLKYGSVQMQPVVPDVLVRPAPDGSFIIELNSDTLPRVLVNRTYLTHVSKTAASAADRNYLLECLQTANWLVKSLDQRARTILRVAEEIVRQQDGFFTHGVQYLRPLNLKTVADAISMHEFDGVARHLQQVHRDAARHLRAQVFLHVGHRLGGRRRIALLGSRAPPHQADDRRGNPGNRPVRRQDRREAQDRRHRDRPAHRRQIPRGDAHPLVGTPAPRQAAHRAGGAAQLTGDGLGIGAVKHDQDLCLPPGCNIGAVREACGAGRVRSVLQVGWPVRRPRADIQDTEQDREAITSGDRLLRIEFVALFLQRMARE